MEKEEKDIRFVARFYRENRLDTTQAWQKLGIGKQRNNSILLYRLITIAAVTFLIAGFSWWWIYDRQDWIVIASSAHAVKEVTLPDNSHITNKHVGLPCKSVGVTLFVYLHLSFLVNEGIHAFCQDSLFLFFVIKTDFSGLYGCRSLICICRYLELCTQYLYVCQFGLYPERTLFLMCD